MKPTITFGNAQFSAPAVGEDILLLGNRGSFVGSESCAIGDTFIVAFADEGLASRVRAAISRSHAIDLLQHGRCLVAPVELCDWPSRHRTEPAADGWLLPRSHHAGLAASVTH